VNATHVQPGAPPRSDGLPAAPIRNPPRRKVNTGSATVVANSAGRLALLRVSKRVGCAQCRAETESAPMLSFVKQNVGVRPQSAGAAAKQSAQPHGLRCREGTLTGA
jgi:hypothetical protein